MEELTIRRAQEPDIPEILRLLSQVLEIHARIRPDIFVSGTTKYSHDELSEILRDEKRPVYVAVTENGIMAGYAFCALREPSEKDNMRKFRSFFIDDLCVDEKMRGRGAGTRLFSHARQEAERLGCYEMSLCVWEGNDSARRFYDSLGMKPKETIMELILEEKDDN